MTSPANQTILNNLADWDRRHPFAADHPAIRNQLDRLAMTNQLHDRIQKLKTELADIAAELAKSEAPPAPKPRKWEPPGSGVVLRVEGLFNSSLAHDSAWQWLDFYLRLAQLAAYVNPSGRVGGRYVVLCRGGVCWYGADSSVDSADTLFETKDAAEKAAEIMTRDGWRVPENGRAQA